MKALITVFACFNTLLLFGYIYFQSSLVGLSYQRQRQERTLVRLQQEQAILLQELESLQSLDLVDSFAREKLGMVPARIGQVYAHNQSKKSAL